MISILRTNEFGTCYLSDGSKVYKSAEPHGKYFIWKAIGEDGEILMGRFGPQYFGDVEKAIDALSNIRGS